MELEIDGIRFPIRQVPQSPDEPELWIEPQLTAGNLEVLDAAFKSRQECTLVGAPGSQRAILVELEVNHSAPELKARLFQIREA